MAYGLLRKGGYPVKMRYVLLLFLFPVSLQCQNPPFEFAWTVTAPRQYDALRSVQPGPGTDLYLYGQLADTCIFNSDSMIAGSPGLFLVRCTQQGNVLWKRIFTGKGKPYPIRIATDKLKNIYILGSYLGGPIVVGNNTLNLGSTYHQDFFIAKADPNGNVLWARSLGITDWWVFGLAVDSQGCVIVTGTFAFTISSAAGQLQSKGLYDIFVMKYDTHGNALWARSGGSPGYERYSFVAVDKQDNIFVNGNFDETMTWDGHIIANSGKQDMFIVKLSPAGQYIWSRSIPRVWTWGIASDPHSNAWVTAAFYKTTSVGNQVFTGAGDDILLAKFDSLGQAVFATQIGGSGSESPLDLTSDNSGNIYLSGAYGSDTCVIHSTQQFTLTNPHTGPYNSKPQKIFVARVSNSGSVDWVKSPAMKGAYVSGQTANHSVADDKGNVYTCGYTWSTSYFDQDSVPGNQTTGSAFLTKIAAKIEVTGDQAIGRLNSACIFPNPVSDLLYVRIPWNDGPATVRLFDEAGREVWKREVVMTSGNLKVTTGNVEPGFYSLQVVTPFGRQQGKVVISRD